MAPYYPPAGGGGGVTTLASSGGAGLIGAVTLSSGTSISLSQVGQDIQIVGVAPGAVTLGSTEIDFGATPVSSGTFTITDAGISTGSKIMVALRYDAPTNKDVDELDMDKIQCIAGQCTGGSCLVRVVEDDGSYLADKFKLIYLIGS